MEPTSTGSKYTIPAAIIVAGLLIAGAVYMKDRLPAPQTANDPTKDVVIAPVSKNDHIMGNPNADIVVVEYSDLECPFCKLFHETMHKIMDEYGKNGTVAWVYRNFPIQQLHPKALKEAEASECAAALGGNDAYWKFIDRVFAITPSNNGLDPTELPKIAKGIGLDQKQFSDCLNGGTYTERINNNVAAAIATIPQAELGTPYSYVLLKNGDHYPIRGNQPYEVVKQVIDTILQTPQSN